MVDELLSDMRERMEQSIKALQNDFDTIRTGRANSALVERMPVECYGAFSPLVQIASISVPDAQAILIRPYNPDDLTAIERAISTSELGINPQNDGKQIRLLIPPLTEERRRDLTKQVGARAEQGRVAIRNIRRDVISDLRDMESESMITEDDLHASRADVQKGTEEFIDAIETLADAKVDDIMTL